MITYLTWQDKEWLEEVMKPFEDLGYTMNYLSFGQRGQPTLLFKIFISDPTESYSYYFSFENIEKWKNIGIDLTRNFLAYWFIRHAEGYNDDEILSEFCEDSLVNIKDFEI